jgi:hypothetical protein
MDSASSRRWFRTAFSLVAALLLYAVPAQAADRPSTVGISAPPDLLPGDAQAASVSAASGSWLVGATPDGRSGRIARRFRAELLLEGTGSYRVVRRRARGFAASLTRAGRYRWAEPDALAKRQAFPADPLTRYQWSLPAVGATLHDPPPVTANSPLIGILEGGFDPNHPDMQGVGYSPGADTDAEGVAHGTGVASVASAPANGQGIVGFWPGARTVVFANGLSCGTASEALMRAVEADAAVVNMSYTFPNGCFTHQLATQLAYGAGTVMVAAAGNEFQLGNPQDVSPATDPHVITVGAVNADLSSAYFSNENLAIDLAAPGVGVLSAVPVPLDADASQDGYMQVDGTSFSAPMVTAAAAWVKQQRPHLHHTQLTDLMRGSALDLGESGWDPSFGFGLFDMDAALNARAPGVDPVEPNDDIPWVNGRYFGRADPALWAGSRRGSYVRARLDRLEDPFDVYRISLPGRSAFRAKLRPRYGNPQLEAYNPWARTVKQNRGRIAYSFEPGRRMDSVTIWTTGRRRSTIYLSVWPSSLDAGYRLTVDRANYRRVSRYR